MNRTPPFTAAFIPKRVGTRGVEDAYTHLKILDSLCKKRSRGETYPAISVDVGVEEIRFEPKTGVHDGQMVRVDPTNNLLHFWWVEGVILREGELCNEHSIFKVGALVITFKHVNYF